MTDPIVIIGGGPVGLAAALAAIQAGCRNVHVLEKRGPEKTRVHTLLLDHGIMADLQSLGVDTSGFTPAEKLILVDLDAGVEAHMVLEHVPRTRPRKNIGDLFPRRSPAVLVSINALETALIDALTPSMQASANVTLEFSADVQDLETTPGAVRVCYTNAASSESVIDASCVVIADGAHSPSLNALGVRTVGQRDMGSVVTGHFPQPGNACLTAADHSGFDHLVYLASGNGTSVFVEIPPGSELLDFNPDTDAGQARLDAFLRQGAQRIGVSGDMLFGHGHAQRLALHSGRSKKTLVNDRVFVMGDAARTTHPSLGLGVNWGIRDAMRFGQSLGKAGTPFTRRRALMSYRLHTWTSSLVLQGLGFFMALSHRRRCRAYDKQRVSRGNSRTSAWRLAGIRFAWRAGAPTTLPAPQPVELSRPGLATRE